MTIEQPAKWNKFVDDSIPLTWEKRLGWLHVALPILLVSGLLFSETILLRAWMDDLPLGDEIFLALLAPFFVFAIFFGGVELQIQYHHRAKRVLRLKEKKFRVSHDKVGVIRFQNISAWRFEPLFGPVPLQKFSIEYARSGRRGLARFWSMALNPEQVAAVHEAIETLRNAGKTSAPVFETSPPKPIERPAGKFSGGLSFALAFFLFVHGFPLLMFGLLPPNASKDSRPTQKPRQNLEKAMEALDEQYVFSGPEIQYCFVLIGGGITGIAMVLYVSALRDVNREKRRCEEIPKTQSFVLP